MPINLETFKERVRAANTIEAVIGETIQLIRDGENRLRGLCPFHKDTNPSLVVDTAKGLWKCFGANCGASGDVFAWIELRDGVDFTEALHRAACRAGISSTDTPPSGDGNRPQPIDPALPARLHTALLNNPDILDWLAAERGYLPETIKRFELGWHTGKKVITLPVRGRDGTILTIRTYNPSTREKRALFSGYGSHLFPLNLLDGQQEVVVCAGEWDCLLLWQDGFAAVTGTAGEGTWREEWSRELQGLSVSVLYDRDEAGHKGATKVATSLLPFASEVKVLTLPDMATDPSGKLLKDYTDFRLAAEREPDELSILIANAAPFTLTETADVLQVLSAAQVFDLPSPTLPATLLEGALYRTSVVLLNGVSGIGKSTMIYGLCAAAAQGKAWFDRQFDRPLRVLLCDIENPEHLIPTKFGEAGVQRSDPLYLLRDRLRLPDHMERLTATVKQERFDLVVIDTLNRAYPVRDENDNAEADRQMTLLKQLADETGACVLVVWHVGKELTQSRHAVYAGRGASARAAATDVVLNVEAETDAILKITTVKNRWNMEQPLEMRLRRAGRGQFKLLDTPPLPESELRACQQWLLSWLTTTRKRADIVSVAGTTGHSEATTKRALEALVKEGRLGQPKRGYYAPTHEATINNLSQLAQPFDGETTEPIMT